MTKKNSGEKISGSLVVDIEKFILIATDLMNYCYCPRIIYFVHVMKIPQATTRKEYKGREKDLEFMAKSKRTKVVKDAPPLPKLFQVHMQSDELEMKTIADSIMINEAKKEAYPIQAKYAFAPREIYKTQKLQLAMEAMLIEDKFKHKVPFGYIKFMRSNELIKVSINTELKDDVIQCFQNIKEITRTERMPKGTEYKKRCADCCYKNIC